MPLSFRGFLSFLVSDENVEIISVRLYLYWMFSTTEDASTRNMLFFALSILGEGAGLGPKYKYVLGSDFISGACKHQAFIMICNQIVDTAAMFTGLLLCTFKVRVACLDFSKNR